MSKVRNALPNSWSHTDRAFCRLKLGRKKEALADYQAGVQAFLRMDQPETAEDSLYEAMLQTARLQAQLGDLSGAKQTYVEIIKKPILGSANLVRLVEGAKRTARDELKALEVQAEDH